MNNENEYYNEKQIQHDSNNIDMNFEKEKCLNMSNQKHECTLCDYTSLRKNNYDRHMLSSKHIRKTQENVKKHKCSMCNFEGNNSYNYNLHLSSKKHIQNLKNQESNKNIDLSANTIDISMNNVEIFKNEIISTLMNQLNFVLEENKNILAEQTQTRLMIETQNKLLIDVTNKSNANNTNNITNNQISNQQFNLNMFLNETCKDAMNLSDFLENLNVSMEDMEKTGELGFAKGMSRIIMNNLNAIDVCKRPIHCSDVKRETLYVKNNGVWEKETEDRKRTKEIIYKVSRLNLKELLKWRDLPRNKGYDKSDHIKNDEFTNLVMEINKMREEEFDKVITSVSKHVAIDKEKVKDKVKMSGYLN
jgi:hypothetical protein